MPPRKKREDVEVWKITRPGKLDGQGQRGPDEVVGYVLGMKGTRETLRDFPTYVTESDADAAIPTVPAPRG